MLLSVSAIKVMGIYLSSPKTEKFSEDGGNDRVKYGLSSMQGWRATMEDAVSIPATYFSYMFCDVICGMEITCLLLFNLMTQYKRMSKRKNTYYIFTAFYLGKSKDFGLSKRFIGHVFKFIVACSLSDLSNVTCLNFFDFCFSSHFIILSCRIGLSSVLTGLLTCDMKLN